MKHTVVALGVMLLLAGCAGGTGDVTPRSSPTTSLQETMSDGQTATTGTASSALDGGQTTGQDLDASAKRVLERAWNQSDRYAASARINITYLVGSEKSTLTIINDSEKELSIYNHSGLSGPTTFYVTDGPDALRNRTTGEIRYGTGRSQIEIRAEYNNAAMLISTFDNIGVMDWQPERKTTIDGETGYVYEANSLNQSALDANERYARNYENVTAAEGTMIVTKRGAIQSSSVTINRPNKTTSVELHMESGDHIEVDQPDWVDKSKFGS
jgi:hypothetical protein